MNSQFMGPWVSAWRAHTEKSDVLAWWLAAALRPTQVDGALTIKVILVLSGRITRPREWVQFLATYGLWGTTPAVSAVGKLLDFITRPR